ncbi:hypothetical protein [Catalinimonas niigatensis]|uniref:hypothetical protein n=1 Tax=Catalinimonas niigatensis TaxID=1397264 RepID=UPI0026659BC3|nr:hypothetical protein [Catalinimonas niigatensis]WPP53530.1 hypothetical protein PZB72_14240 [Catalinimonas niigatensis]
MGIKDFFKTIFQKRKAGKAEATIDKEYSSQNSFPDQEQANSAFERAKSKLFDVNSWSKLGGLTSRFELHDEHGRKPDRKKPEIGDFIRIMLPAPTPENWVKITDITVKDKIAEFTVNPSKDPRENEEDVEHFFIKEATSTFRVELKGQTLYASEIGKNEAPNNEGKEAGERGVLNTLISAGGWIAFQELQWKKLTAYLVHKEEAKEEKV